jgi:uncharacterized lipoprotein YajG
MTSLRHRLMATVSVLVILAALVVLPGCKKSSTSAPEKAPTKKAPTTGME